jgi:glycosyltransferase involved in cell wall biosynthesis
VKAADNSTLYIDVTQLVHWSGKLTGIPRVMNELSIRFSTQPDVVSIIWDAKYKRFSEIDLLQTLQSRGHRIHYVAPDTITASLFKKGSATRQKLISDNTYAKLMGYMPGKRTMRRVANATERAQLPVVKLMPTDTLFVLWGEWASGPYIDELVAANNNGVKLIQIVYDLLPIVTPQYSGHSTKSMQSYNLQILPLCSLILSISESTKRDLVEWLKSSELHIPDIAVFRLGDDFQQTETRLPKDKTFAASSLKGGDYLLCVGTIEARKNHTLLYYVYKLAHSKGVVLPKLVIVGRKGWRTDNIYDIISDDPETKSTMLFLTDTSDEELSWLYQNALFSIYPSFYEGWGLPIAESIANGIPCLASNSSSMPEIGGDIIDYFNPVSPEECLLAIEHLLRPGEITKAKQRLKAYRPTSWEQTFQQVNQHVKELYGTKD